MHKQQAGFSQASQIHKKDAHIAGQARYCSHDRFNNAFMMHASTSPFYPIFAAAGRQRADARQRQRRAALGRPPSSSGIEARKMILEPCSMIRPFVPVTVHGAPWQDADTEEIADEQGVLRVRPGAAWHGFDGYTKDQYFLRSEQLLLTSPDLTSERRVRRFGNPGHDPRHHLRENGDHPREATSTPSCSC